MNAIMGDSVASPLVWAITVVVTVGVLLVDLFVIGRRPHEPSMGEVSRHLVFFIGLFIMVGALVEVGVIADLGVMAEIDRLGRGHADAGIQEAAADHLLHQLFRRGHDGAIRPLIIVPRHTLARRRADTNAPLLQSPGCRRAS